MADLLLKFFEVYSEWKWLDAVSIKISKKKDKLNMNALQVLNSVSYDPMIILTPIANPKNSAYRVTQFTFETIIKEFKRAKEIIQNLAPCTIKKIRKPETIENCEEHKEQKDESETEFEPKYKWTRLFKKLRFFQSFNHFIKIDILSNNSEAHNKWLGYVESQLRRLF